MIKTKEEINIIREGGHILGKIMDEIILKIEPGVDTEFLTNLAEKQMLGAGGKPSFKGLTVLKDQIPFPDAICTSINEELVHAPATPGRILKDGDIIGIDMGLEYRGMFTDMARTVPVGSVTNEAKKLLLVTQSALKMAISAIKPNKSVFEVGKEIWVLSKLDPPSPDMVSEVISTVKAWAPTQYFNPGYPIKHFIIGKNLKHLQNEKDYRYITNQKKFEEFLKKQNGIVKEIRQRVQYESENQKSSKIGHKQGLSIGDYGPISCYQVEYDAAVHMTTPGGWSIKIIKAYEVNDKETWTLSKLTHSKDTKGIVTCDSVKLGEKNSEKYKYWKTFYKEFIIGRTWKWENVEDKGLIHIKNEEEFETLLKKEKLVKEILIRRIPLEKRTGHLRGMLQIPINHRIVKRRRLFSRRLPTRLPRRIEPPQQNHRISPYYTLNSGSTGYTLRYPYRHFYRPIYNNTNTNMNHKFIYWKFNNSLYSEYYHEHYGNRDWLWLNDSIN